MHGFSNLKSKIHYTILIRKEWSFIIRRPIDAISINKPFTPNQKRILKKTIRKKNLFLSITTIRVKLSKRGSTSSNCMAINIEQFTLLKHFSQSL